MSVSIILYIILAHWFADFVMQDEQWAINKYKSHHALDKHVATYSITMMVFMLPLLGLVNAAIFMAITFIAHYATDFVSSRIVHDLFEKKIYGTSIPNRGGFTVIGMDQVIHYAQLFITFKLLM